MNKNKARIITYASYSSYKQLFNLAKSLKISKGYNEETDKELVKTILLIATNINYDVINPIFKKYPELEKEIEDMYEEFNMFPC